MTQVDIDNFRDFLTTLDQNLNEIDDTMNAIRKWLLYMEEEIRLTEEITYDER